MVGTIHALITPPHKQQTLFTRDCRMLLTCATFVIHHDTSFRFILEDDSIFSTSKVHIRSCSCKWAKLWLIARPSICSFCISHSTFTSTLCFCFGLIQPSASSFFMVSVNTIWTHLAHIYSIACLKVNG
jgi:hypothetical protein